jgi:uncharacterized membrane protein HdeD (DUF308 family)
VIQPTEEVPGEYGHPRWKLNVFVGLLLCVLGVLMMVSVYLLVYGVAVLALGIAWAVTACIVGLMQERGDARHKHVTPR